MAFGSLSSLFWSRDFHFLDVGHGDCTIVDIPNHLTVVDINNCKTFAKESEAELRTRYQRPVPNLSSLRPFGSNSALSRALSGMQPLPQSISLIARAMEAEQKLREAKDKLTNPIDYLKARFPGRSIFRYIQTHPDMDHMAGLLRLVEEQIQIVNFWDTHHCIEKDEDALRNANVNKDIRDWHTYRNIRQQKDNPVVLRLKADDKGDFFTADGISVWAPLDHRHATNPNADPNALSYVLFLQVGKCNVVLGGDATVETWEEIYRRRNGVFPKIHLLKASHHGRKSGYHVESVKAMRPDVTIVSVGELKAKDDAAASYERFSVKGCYSTVEHGDIVASCWNDGDVWLRERDGDYFLKSFA